MLEMAVVLTLSAVQPMATNAGVAAGVTAYDELRYRDAIPRLEAALAEPTLSRADQIIALGTVARACAILQRGDEARQRFVQLLELDPAYLVGYDEPPAVTQSFQAAREDFQRLHPDRPLQAVAVAPEPRPIWPWLVGGSAVAAAAVIVTIILVRNGGPDRPGDLNDTWVLP